MGSAGFLIMMRKISPGQIKIFPPLRGPIHSAGIGDMFTSLTPADKIFLASLSEL